MRTAGLLLAACLAASLLAGCVQGDGDQGRGDAPTLGRGCTDDDPRRPAPPSEQEVNDRLDLQCAGHFMIVDEGGGHNWSVPEWKIGQWWRYQIVGYTQEAFCAMEFIETVERLWLNHDVPVYTMETNQTDCDGQALPNGLSRDDKTLGSIARIRADGYVHHDVIFPLQEGKRWAYVDHDGRIVDVTVAYVPEHTHDGETVEAWLVELTRHVNVKEQWWGVAAGNMLREETRDPKGTILNAIVLQAYGPDGS